MIARIASRCSLLSVAILRVWNSLLAIKACWFNALLIEVLTANYACSMILPSREESWWIIS